MSAGVGISITGEEFVLDGVSVEYVLGSYNMVAVDAVRLLASGGVDFSCGAALELDYSRMFC